MEEDKDRQPDAEEQEEEGETPEQETPEEEDEPEDEPEGEPEGEDHTAEVEKHKKAFEDQKRRAEKAEARLKELEAKAKESGRAPKKNAPEYEALEKEISRANERAERAELAVLGVKHPDDIQFVRDAAKRLGVDVSEAASDELVASKLDRMRRTRESKEATPSPRRSGGGTPTNNIGKLADKVAAGGELPSDPALAEKVQKELARRSQAAS